MAVRPANRLQFPRLPERRSLLLLRMTVVVEAKKDSSKANVDNMDRNRLSARDDPFS